MTEKIPCEYLKKIISPNGISFICECGVDIKDYDLLDCRDDSGCKYIEFANQVETVR